VKLLALQSLFQKGRPDLFEIENKKSKISVFRSVPPCTEVEAVFETASQ